MTTPVSHHRLLGLPKEILVDVGSRLDLASLRNFANTCRHQAFPRAALQQCLLYVSVKARFSRQPALVIPDDIRTRLNVLVLGWRARPSSLARMPAPAPASAKRQTPAAPALLGLPSDVFNQILVRLDLQALSALARSRKADNPAKKPLLYVRIVADPKCKLKAPELDHFLERPMRRLGRDLRREARIRATLQKWTVDKARKSDDKTRKQLRQSIGVLPPLRALQVLADHYALIRACLGYDTADFLKDVLAKVNEACTRHGRWDTALEAHASLLRAIAAACRSDYLTEKISTASTHVGPVIALAIRDFLNKLELAGVPVVAAKVEILLGELVYAFSRTMPNGGFRWTRDYLGKQLSGCALAGGQDRIQEIISKVACNLFGTSYLSLVRDAPKRSD